MAFYTDRDLEAVPICTILGSLVVPAIYPAREDRVHISITMFNLYRASDQ